MLPDHLTCIYLTYSGVPSDTLRNISWQRLQALYGLLQTNSQPHVGAYLRVRPNRHQAVCVDVSLFRWQQCWGCRRAHTEVRPYNLNDGMQEYRVLYVFMSYKNLSFCPKQLMSLCLKHGRVSRSHLRMRQTSEESRKSVEPPCRGKNKWGTVPHERCLSF